MQGEGWGGSTNDFHVSLVSHGLVSAGSLTVTRSSPPTHEPWHRSSCAVSEQKEYPNWALPSFDSNQQGKAWEHSSTFLKMLTLAGYLKHPAPNNCYKKLTSELHK